MMDESRSSCRASCPPHSVRSALCKEAWQCWDMLAPWPAARRRPLRDGCRLALSSEGFFRASCLRGPGYFLQSCKIIDITGACLPEGQPVEHGAREKEDFAPFSTRACSCLIWSWVLGGHRLPLRMLNGRCHRSRGVRAPWDCWFSSEVLQSWGSH